MTIINCNSKGNCKLKFGAWNTYSLMGWRIEELEAVDILCMQGVPSTHPSSIMPAQPLKVKHVSGGCSAQVSMKIRKQKEVWWRLAMFAVESWDQMMPNRPTIERAEILLFFLLWSEFAIGRRWAKPKQTPGGDQIIRMKVNILIVDDPPLYSLQIFSIFYLTPWLEKVDDACAIIELSVWRCRLTFQQSRNLNIFFSS